MKGKFEVFESVDSGIWYFRLVAANGKIIAQSEGYSRPRNALKGIAAIKKIAKSAPIVILK